MRVEQDHSYHRLLVGAATRSVTQAGDTRWRKGDHEGKQRGGRKPALARDRRSLSINPQEFTGFPRRWNEASRLFWAQ
jgi:hypothetical protein